MKKDLITKILITLSITLLLCSCRSGRPDMAKDMEGKGAVQDIETFNVVKTAENFRETADQFAADVKKIKSKNNANETYPRRVSLDHNSGYDKTPLTIVDHNEYVKKLETKEVSLKFNNMDIRSALKLFASLAQRNIIIGDEVSGNITVDFEDIKWGSAVYALLDINSLIMIADEDSNLLRVHTKDVFVQLEQDKIDRTLEVKKNSITLGSGGSSNLDADGNPGEIVLSEVFRVFNQTSGDMIEPIQAMLGEDATVEITDDEINNQLFVKGSPEELSTMERILEQLDIERKQVLIEAYLINASDNFSENFKNNLNVIQAESLDAGQDGISFVGVDATPGSATAVTNELQGEGAFNTEGTIATDYFSDAALNGSALILGNIGIARLKAVINMSIDQKFSEAISNPKLFALDGQTSTITQGNQLLKTIPAAGDAAGSTVTINENLSMNVTPNILGQDKVELNLSINNSSPGETDEDAVATNTESLTSIVRIKTGEVAILGGVYKNTKNDNNNFVPFFSKIPLLGTFFRTETKTDNKNQLLIFISANIV